MIFIFHIGNEILDIEGSLGGKRLELIGFFQQISLFFWCP